MSRCTISSNPDEAISLQLAAAGLFETDGHVTTDAARAVADGTQGRVRDAESGSGLTPATARIDITKKVVPGVHGAIRFVLLPTIQNGFRECKHHHYDSDTSTFPSVSHAMRQFHEIIDQRRKDKDLTVEQVCDLMDRALSAQGKKPPALASVGHWFNGTRRLPRNMDHLRALCDVLDMQVGEAMGDKPMEAKTALEQVILQKARPLSERDQEMLIAIIDRMVAG